MTVNLTSRYPTYHSHSINRAFGSSPSLRKLKNIAGKLPRTIGLEYQMVFRSEDILRGAGVYDDRIPVLTLIATLFDGKAVLHSKLHITRLDYSLCLNQKETFELIAQQSRQVMWLVIPPHVALEMG